MKKQPGLFDSGEYKVFTWTGDEMPYGPFASFEAAWRFIHQKFPNPEPGKDFYVGKSRQKPGSFLQKALTTGFVMLLTCYVHAWDCSDNPDKYPSIGVDVSSGKQAGFLTDHLDGWPHSDGGFVKGALDVRVPLSNAVTLHAFGSSTGINNNLQYSNGNEVGFGMRVYLK